MSPASCSSANSHLPSVPAGGSAQHLRVASQLPRPSVAGYDFTSCPTGTLSGATCRPRGCAEGYAGSPKGSYTCVNGTWDGLASGCSVRVTELCPAYRQTGYQASSNCGAGTASGTVCEEPACAAGYAAVVEETGGVMCVGGVYAGAFRGCRRKAADDGQDAAGVVDVRLGDGDAEAVI